MRGSKKKVRGREKGLVALLLVLFITANMIAGDLSSVLVQGALTDASVTGIELEEGLDAEQIVFCPGNNYGFRCNLENAGVSEDIEWTVSAEGQTDTAGINITEDGADQTKAVLHIGEEAKPGTQFTVAASIAEKEGSEAKYEQITVAGFGGLSVQDLEIWSDPSDADAEILTVKTTDDGVNWIKSETAVVKLGRTDSGYNQYSLNSEEWKELTTDGMPIRGTKQQIRFRNSSSTQISETVELNCDGIGPTVTVTAEPSEEGWTNQQKYKVTANDNESGSGVKQIYYYDTSDPEGTLDSVPDNGEISFSKIEDAGKTLVFYAVDDLDNKGEDSAQYTINDIDTTPPVVTVTKDGEQLQNQYILNKEDVENGENVFDVTASEEASGLYTFTYDKGEGAIPVDGVDLSGTDPIFSATGKVTVDTTQGETEAKYIYTVNASDKAGNVSESKEINVLYDPVAPAVSSIEMPKVTENGNWISAAMTSDDNEEGIKVNILVSDGENENASGIKGVEYQICAENSNPNDEKWEEIPSDGQGNYAVDIKEKVKNLVDGNYKIYVRAEDNAGNISENASADFGVDKTVSNVSVEMPEVVTKNGNWISDAMTSEENKEGIKINFLVSDGENSSGIASVKYQICEGSSDPDDEKWEEITSDGQGNYTVDIKEKVKDLVDGNYKICVKAEDIAGNVDDKIQGPFKIDKTAPSDISVHVSDIEDASKEDETIWESIDNKWENLVDFITGKETIYIDVYAVDNGSGVGSIECIYQENGETEKVTLSVKDLGISTEGEKTVYHFEQKVKIQTEKGAQILSVTVTDNASNKTDIQNPDTNGNIPHFIVDNTAPALDVRIEKDGSVINPVYTDEKDVAYYNGAALTEDDKLEIKLTLKEDNFLKDGVNQYDESGNNANHYGRAYEKFTITKYEKILDGWKEVNDLSSQETNAGSIVWERDYADSNEYTAVLELEPGYKYEISYEMNDGADNTLTGGEIDGGLVNDGIYTYTLAVDNTNPKGNIQVDGYCWNEIEANNEIKYYYNGKNDKGEAPVSITAQVQEDMFFAKDAKIIKEFVEPGGASYGEPEGLSGEWNTTTTENTYRFSVDPSSFSADGDYKFTLDYKDRAQNEMLRSNDVENDWNNKTFAGEDTNTEQIIVIDQTAPEISLEYSQEGKTYTYETDPETGETTDITYFDDDTTLTVKVKEHNFDPAKVELDLFLSNPRPGSDSKVDTEVIKKYFKEASGWTTEVDEDGTTWNVASYKFPDEVRYDVAVNVTDLAGNPAEEVSDSFVIDKTEPEINSVTLSPKKGVRTYGEGNDIRTYYDAEKVILKIEVTEHNFYDIFSTEYDLITKDGLAFTSEDISGEEIPLKMDEEALVTLADYINDKGNWKPVNGKEDIYELTYEFSKESNYTLSKLQLQDLAGHNSVAGDNSGGNFEEKPLHFTIDGTAPDINYEISCDRSILNYLTFGYFGKKRITITATVKDEISGIYGFTFESVEVEGADIKRQDASQNDSIRDTQLTEKPVGEDTFSWSTPVDAESNPVDFRGYVSGISEDYSGNGLDEEEKADIEKGIIVETADKHEDSSSLSLRYDREPNEYGFYNDGVEVTVQAEDSYSGIYSVAYTARTSETAEPEYKSNENFWEKENAEIADSYEKTFELDKNIYYSNDVHVYAETEDNAGYINTVEDVLKIDSRKPEISVTYNNLSPANGNYYNQTRIATVIIDERNFDANRTQLVWTSTGDAPTISDWTHNGEHHTAYVTFSADADYTFTVRSTDLADNVADYSRIDTFTVDQTDPVIQVTYDNNDAQNGNYYNAQRTATIQITEHNFNAADVQIIGTATENGAGVTFPSASGWSSSGDVHTATITYSQDAHYTFDIAYTDMAGNAAADYQEDQFAVDQTAPEIVIRGVKDESANNADQIGFVITASDNNFDTMTPRLMKSVREENNNFITKAHELGSEQISGTSHSYTVENLEDDGIYSLTCTVVDMAGNTCERVTLQDNDGNTYTEMSYPGTEEPLLEFSVNRLGSTYRILVNPEGINNGITNAEADDISVRIEEINVDELEEGSTRLDLYNGITAKQIKLVPGVNYETGEAEGSGGWRMYTYTLNGENFVDDGNYQVGVYSVDKAGNESDSSLNEKAKVSFIVDRTAPELSMNVKSRTSYDEVEKIVELNITELHLDKSGVVIEVNGQPQEIQETTPGQYEFALKSGMNQRVSVTCTDQAGNKTELSEDRITVSTNIMVRAGAWVVNNLMIFLAIVFILLLLIILIIVWRVNENRKRRIEIEEE